MTTSLAESLPGHNPVTWAYDWLRAINAPVTLANLQLVYSWERMESGGGGGMFNPLNTVLPWPGSTDYNSVGVQEYLSYEDGLGASVQVIHEPQYTDIYASLRLGNDINRTADAIIASVWGTTKLPFSTLPRFIRGADMIIQSGRKPTVQGQVAYTIPSLDGEKMELWNGARLVNDTATPNPNLFLWHPMNLVVGVKIIGASVRINDPQNPSSGGETRSGIVVADDSGRNHNGFWK